MNDPKAKPEKHAEYQFLQAVHIRPQGGHPGKDFGLGVHKVSPVYEYDPYFLKLIGAGLIVEHHQKSISTQTDAERAQALMEKIQQKKLTRPTQVLGGNTAGEETEANRAERIKAKAQASAEAPREGASNVDQNLTDDVPPLAAQEAADDEDDSSDESSESTKSKKKKHKH